MDKVQETITNSLNKFEFPLFQPSKLVFHMDKPREYT